MAEVVVTERFVADAAEVSSDRAFAKIEEALRALERFPEMGSSIIPDLIRRRFGSTVRKLVAAQYDIVYEYDPSSDRVHVLALIPCKVVH